MKLRTLKEYDAIELHEAIRGTLGDEAAIEDHPERTVGRDKTANWIQQHIVGDGEWPITATEIETMLGEDSTYDGPQSRQHITNVLEHYFQPAGGGGFESGGGSTDRGVTHDSNPMSAAPEDVKPQERPPVAPTGQAYVAVVEDGQFQHVSEVPIPDGTDDVETYLQGVFAVAADL